MKTFLLACGLSLLAAPATQDAPPADERQLYKLGPDSQRQEGVPRGTVTKYSWKSRIFAGTERDYWVYVPAQIDPSRPAAVM
ncbi:MAG: esterase family protein, partial [Planctomycetota bacterium]